MLEHGARRFELTLRPVSGKAVPVAAGEILRITQVEGGGQCVDFNAFHLHDYKEYMDVSMSRPLHGFRVRAGDIIFSNPPHMRPLLAIVAMAETCVTDLLGRMCNAVLFEAGYGFEHHTNCQDTMAAAIAAYGLLPEDTHHSLNLWMDTEWDSTGQWFMRRNSGRAGDTVDFLACTDILAGVAICGAGDVSVSSNFWFKPIRLEIFEASGQTQQLVEKIMKRAGAFGSQRRADRGRAAAVRTDRRLAPIAGFTPQFVNYPMPVSSIDVPVSRDQLGLVEKLVDRGYGDSVEDVVRRALMSWILRHRSQYFHGASLWTKVPLSWL
jgi:uncharacterized protein YcgI (DUF1989 family)